MPGISQSQRKSSTQRSPKPSQSRHQDIDNEDELIKNCVRFFLYKAGDGAPIRKIDVQKVVLKNVGRNFSSIINKVKNVLNEVYGYDIYECDDGQTAVRYLMSSLLPYQTSSEVSFRQLVRDDDELDVPEDAHKVLVMIVLAHIFMCNNNNVTQGTLFAFLQLLKIDPEVNHAIFGNVKTFITNTMINQKYLITETEDVTKHVCYKWGPRAEREISKHELLKFVCKIYKDRTPKSWENQFEVANAQVEIQQNRHQNGIDEMEVDD